MIVTVNGKEKKLKAGSTLKTAIAGEPYVKGTLIAVHLSEERLVSETSDFEIETERGTMVLHLNDSPEAAVWKARMADHAGGMNARWVTHDIVAFGSFPTNIEVDRNAYRYSTYDCFLALGGFDNHTTYMMVARDNHTGSYGAGQGIIGRITVGRHILGLMREGDKILSVKPMMSETSTENVKVTDDLSFPLEDGYRVETGVSIELNPQSPESAEHVLILSSGGVMNITQATGSFLACTDDMDVAIPKEDCSVRDVGTVTVRNDGVGTGRLYMYKERRQVSQVHNVAGMVSSGRAILAYAGQDTKVTVTTEPPRALSVGMTQADGAKFLEAAGIKQVRTGDTSDDAIIAEQTPEQTITALGKGEVETFGVPRDRIFRIKLSDKDPVSLHYFRKVTGLSHKPVGILKVQFTFEGLPMVTFYGDEVRGKNLYPQDPFKKVKRGDIGLTNQARPHHGLIGIRLEDSKEFGPTGEESYGTNIVGKFVDDLDRLMKDLNEDDTVYITEEEL